MVAYFVETFHLQSNKKHLKIDGMKLKVIRNIFSKALASAMASNAINDRTYHSSHGLISQDTSADAAAS